MTENKQHEDGTITYASLFNDLETFQDDPDGWIDQIDELLEEFAGSQHEAKKRQTIIAIIRAKLANTSVEEVFALPHTCGRTTWHTKWKKQEDISRVLREAEAIAQRYQSQASMRATAYAVETLQYASAEATDELRRLLRSPVNPQIRLKAAIAILDRGSIETAKKETQGNPDDDGRQSLEDWKAQQEAQRRQVSETLDTYADRIDDSNQT